MDKAIDLVSVEELSVEDLPQAVAPGASSAGTVAVWSSAGSCAGTLSSVLVQQPLTCEGGRPKAVRPSPLPSPDRGTDDATHERDRARRVLRLASGVTRGVAADGRSSSGARPDTSRRAGGVEPLIARLEAGCDHDELVQLIRRTDAVDDAGTAATDGCAQVPRCAAEVGVHRGQSGEHSRTDRFLARAGPDFFARLPLPVNIDGFAAACRARRCTVQVLRAHAPRRRRIAAATAVAGGLATVLTNTSELAQPSIEAIAIVARPRGHPARSAQTCHAIAMRTQGARVREIGVGLLYYFVPSPTSTAPRRTRSGPGQGSCSSPSLVPSSTPRHRCRGRPRAERDGWSPRGRGPLPHRRCSSSSRTATRCSAPTATTRSKPPSGR